MPIEKPAHSCSVPTELPPEKGPLSGLRVLDVATLFAGPLIATALGDFGADVIKVEHPKGDPLRNVGHQKNGLGIWWKVANRNKRSITLDLHVPAAQRILLELAQKADVLIENFRPGVLDGWGCSWPVLHQINPRLIVVRATGFGQTGPYRHRPGYGTLAEGFSGFAYLTGDPNGPPTLPPFGHSDGLAALSGTSAVMMALYYRDHVSGKGQEIDLAIYEPIFSLLGPLPGVYQQLGIVERRHGNRSASSAPRNIYKTGDERWIAVSTASPSIFKRLMRLIGREDLAEDPRMSTNHSRVEHADELDAAVKGYTETHDLATILREFDEVGAAVAPIYDIQQIFEDPHFHARKTIIDVPDEDFGSLAMANVVPRLVGSPGGIWRSAPGIGAHTAEILFDELGKSREEIEQLRLARVTG